jgi:hypothetical protein
MRAGVAAEALDALQLFLRDPMVDSSLSEVQATLREAVTLDHIYRILDLGDIIEEIIVRPRERLSSNIIKESPPAFDATKSPFSQEEKTLWCVSNLGINSCLETEVLSILTINCLLLIDSL